jgi:hypothetical protein
MKETGSWARIRNKGDASTQAVKVLSGPRKTLVAISTPCCGVRYRIDLEDIVWQRDHGFYNSVWCGKRRNARGNTPGQDGCRAAYKVTFEGDPPESARWEWLGY